MHSKITTSEAEKLDTKTLKVPNQPDQFLIQLDVFHQLHCLNSVRQALWIPAVDRYRPHFDGFVLENGRRNFTSRGARHLGETA